jgi:hypothetical protein
MYQYHQYQIHPQVGWMYARIRTWFPFQIQVGINGREWLAHQMRLENLKFRQADNCFVWIEDYERAQALMNQQLQTHWPELLGGLAAQLNPLHESIFDEKYPASYYWTCPQSEWATDIVFRRAEFLRRLMPRFVRHSLERATRACAAPMGKRSSLASRREPGRFPDQRIAQPGFCRPCCMSSPRLRIPNSGGARPPSVASYACFELTV